jgi:hypothetical protein
LLLFFVYGSFFLLSFLDDLQLISVNTVELD